MTWKISLFEKATWNLASTKQILILDTWFHHSKLFIIKIEHWQIILVLSKLFVWIWVQVSVHHFPHCVQTNPQHEVWKCFEDVFYTLLIILFPLWLRPAFFVPLFLQPDPLIRVYSLPPSLDHGQSLLWGNRNKMWATLGRGSIPYPSQFIKDNFDIFHILITFPYTIGKIDC